MKDSLIPDGLDCIGTVKPGLNTYGTVGVIDKGVGTSKAYTVTFAYRDGSIRSFDGVRWSILKHSDQHIHDAEHGEPSYPTKRSDIALVSVNGSIVMNYPLPALANETRGEPFTIPDDFVRIAPRHFQARPRLIRRWIDRA